MESSNSQTQEKVFTTEQFIETIKLPEDCQAWNEPGIGVWLCRRGYGEIVTCEAEAKELLSSLCDDSEFEEDCRPGFWPED